MDNDKLNKEIHDKFSDVLNWRYNNRNRDSVVIQFKDGSEVVYDVDKIMKKESITKDEKVSVMEALTEQDIEELSKFSLTDEEIAHILSLFELISDENKDKAFGIIKVLFEGKKLVPDEDKIEESIVTKKRTSVSERYTRMLLGDK